MFNLSNYFFHLAFKLQASDHPFFDNAPACHHLPSAAAAASTAASLIIAYRCDYGIVHP